MPTAVVVLAGGASRRWGGRDKTALRLAGRTVLEHAVRGLVAGSGCRFADAVVAAPAGHPARPALPGVRWVREEPPGGGPVAGLAAAVAVLALPGATVVVGAGDAPLAGTAAPRLLAALEADGDLDGALGVDPSGRRQPLLAAYRLGALTAALAAGAVEGARLQTVVARLRLAGVPVTADESLDLDTPADLAAAQLALDPAQGAR